MGRKYEELRRGEDFSKHLFFRDRDQGAYRATSFRRSLQ